MVPAFKAGIMCPACAATVECQVGMPDGLPPEVTGVSPSGFAEVRLLMDTAPLLAQPVVVEVLEPAAAPEPVVPAEG